MAREPDGQSARRDHPIVAFNRVYCPECDAHVQILRVSKAAQIADVSRKTVYAYVEEGCVHSFTVGKRYECVCLL